jgi:hypothetical protein
MFFFFLKKSQFYTQKEREQFNFYKQKKIVPQRGEIKGRLVHVFTKQSKLSEVARAGSFHGKY